MNLLAVTLMVALKGATALVPGALRCLTAQLTGLKVAARSAEKGDGSSFTTVG